MPAVEPQGSIWLPDYEVFDACMALGSDDNDRLANARMKGIKVAELTKGRDQRLALPHLDVGHVIAIDARMQHCRTLPMPNGPSQEVNLHRREIGEAASERLPGRDLGDAGACAGHNCLSTSKPPSVPAQCFS